jgi:imidazolonepropionase-like amidohydrolase
MIANDYCTSADVRESMAYRIRGTVLPDGDVREVFVTDGRFTFDEVDDAETLIQDGVLIPGLVDVHAHLALASPAQNASTPREAAEASAAAHLVAGVLLVREPGGPDHSSTGIGPEQGLPRVITAGRFLAPPGMYFPGLAREVTDDELPDAAAEELAAGTGWAKVIGDTPLVEPRITRTFTRDALAEAVRRVHDLAGRIAIHCVDPDVIQDAIEVGFDSIEHGSFLRSDQLPSAADSGVAWVPTRSIDAGIRDLVREMAYPPTEIARTEDALDRQPEVLQAAAEAGVPILAGTDAGMVSHGTVRREVELLHAAGLSPTAALGAASWTARAFLGLPGVKEGAPADLVAFREDPRDDLAVLAEPTVIILDGRLVRPAG